MYVLQNISPLHTQHIPVPHLGALDDLGQHDNGANILLPDHAPKVTYCAREGSWGGEGRGAEGRGVEGCRGEGQEGADVCTYVCMFVILTHSLAV